MEDGNGNGNGNMRMGMCEKVDSTRINYTSDVKPNCSFRKLTFVPSSGSSRAGDRMWWLCLRKQGGSCVELFTPLHPHTLTFSHPHSLTPSHPHTPLLPTERLKHLWTSFVSVSQSWSRRRPSAWFPWR